jgi:RNA polymerase sigma factor (sigma-70 family)
MASVNSMSHGDPDDPRTTPQQDAASRPHPDPTHSCAVSEEPVGPAAGKDQLGASQDQIIRALPMVRRLAARYHRTPLGRRDAAGVGALALVEAASRFDPGRGVPFIAFAARRVRGAMYDAYRAERGSHGGRPDWQVPLDPDEMAERFVDHAIAHHYGHLDLIVAIARLRHRLRLVLHLHMCGITHKEIAGRLCVTEARVSQLLGSARRQVLAGLAD